MPDNTTSILKDGTNTIKDTLKDVSSSMKTSLHNAKNTIEDAVDESGLNDNLRKLQDDLAQLRSDLGGITKTLRTITAERASQGLAEAKKVGEKLQETASDVKVSMEEQIVQRPLTTILLAFGLGMVLGKVVDRS